MSASRLKHWREASTLIIATTSELSGLAANLVSSISTDQSTSCSQELIKQDFDVLILKRNRKSKFMPAVHVFPGGVAVDSDFSADWITIFKRLGSSVQETIFKSLCHGSSNAAPMFTRQRDLAFSSIPPEVAFRICAIRETFEEAGVLLASSSNASKKDIMFQQNGNVSPAAIIHADPNLVKEWRHRVNKDPDEFLRMCQELDLVPHVWCLYEWSNWLTPKVEAETSRRRFDTAFYICCLDHKPEALEDGGETVHLQWSSPNSILSAYYKNSRGLAPPQVYELMRLLNFNSASQLLKHVSQPGRDRVERWEPTPVVLKDVTMMALPGDDLHYERSHEDGIRVYTETYEESVRKYPNQHRLVLEDELLIQCSVSSQRQGHVTPRTDLAEKLKKRARL